MGLDNGFIVKSHKRQITREMLPGGIDYPFEDDYGDGPEIIYWRKCWGLRNEIIDILSMTDEQYHAEVDTIDQLHAIEDAILYFFDPVIWETEGDSIWQWHEIRGVLMNSYMNLKVMEQFMRENQDVYLEFYDSY